MLPYSATKRKTIFKTALGLAVPVGGEEMDVRSRRVFHTCLEGEAIEEIADLLEWVCGDYQDESCGFSGRGFDTRGYFLF